MKPEIIKIQEYAGWCKESHRFESIKINGFGLPVVLGMAREYGLDELRTLEIELSGVKSPTALLSMEGPWRFEIEVSTLEARILYTGFMESMDRYSAPLSSHETYTFGCRSVNKTKCPVQPIEFVTITCKLNV
ncbi:hypothetical protein G9G53_22595 [Paenibacillus sp. EKM206P]|uniref:hypothetical protein n=1 Tax=Paenibacillus sp. EKM206P TaxID=1683674 RepID=UPI0013E9DA7B|nr:hypothetical protein [Paenibacillus sp. EKM206P]KAF6569081.1 hypothetical protein G9G53_22595 [Paenibacillus sp. EKM206P]